MKPVGFVKVMWFKSQQNNVANVTVQKYFFITLLYGSFYYLLLLSVYVGIIIFIILFFFMFALGICPFLFYVARVMKVSALHLKFIKNEKILFMNIHRLFKTALLLHFSY